MRTAHVNGVTDAALDDLTDAVAAFCAGPDDQSPEAADLLRHLKSCVSAAQNAGAKRDDCVAAVVDGLDDERAEIDALLAHLGLDGDL